MAIIQNLFDIDTLYHQTERKVILNGLKLTDDSLKDLIYTTSGDKISIIPQCECGYFKKAYLLGKTCPKCNTSVIDTFDEIKPLLWVEKFDTDIKFINPKFWADLNNIINSKIDTLRWLSDINYNPPKIPPILYKLKDLIGGRKYSNVCNNLEEIIVYLKHNGQFKTLPKKVKLNALHRVYKLKKDILFSNTLPLINKKLFISEQSIDGSYNSILLADIIDIAMTIVTTANEIDLTKSKIENIMAKIISNSAKLFVSYMREMVSRKLGLLRKNIYGTRAHFTFRTVISANLPSDAYDSITVPWIIGLTAFRPHVMNKLAKRGYVLKDASKKVFDAELQYDGEISRILDELIEESPYSGIPVFGNRNPSLGKSSIQTLMITGFEKNPLVTVTSMSKQIFSGFNADLDGDALNFTLLLSNKMVKLAEPFRPIYNLNSLDVYKVSGNLNLPKTTAITMANYLNTEETEAEQCDIYDLLTQEPDINLATNNL